MNPSDVPMVTVQSTQCTAVTSKGLTYAFNLTIFPHLPSMIRPYSPIALCL